MSSRDIILNKIKNANQVKETPLPTIENFGITYEDKIEKFKQSIKSVGGEGITASMSSINTIIKNLYPTAKTIASNVENCELGNFNCNEKTNPAELKDIDLAIVKGEFAVAENGAVWMKNTDNRHRALYFIAQNIVIVIKKEDIVNNMHEAYKKINFDDPGYGVFISGPSKTADIEQSLVIGAHGPKSGYVIFV